MPEPGAIEARSADRCRVWIGAALTGAVAIGAAFLLLRRSEWINGSHYWRWGYQAEQVAMQWALLIAGVTTALCAAAWAIHRRAETRERVALSLFVLAVAALGLRLSVSWLFGHEVSLQFIDHVVRNDVTGSYFATAERISSRPGMLANYPEWMAFMPLHAKNKPPGLPLVNLAFIKVLGNDSTQQTAGIVGLVGGLISLGCIPLLYKLVVALGGNSAAAFHAAALWTLCPGAAIFFPLFDPVLTLFALGLAILWTLAIRRDRYTLSATMGVLLAATLFFTFNILPIGLFLAAIGLYAVPGRLIARLKLFTRHAAVVLATAAALHVAFGLLTGFNLIATLKAALANQATLLELIDRPYPATVWWDLVDYALGVAWVPVVLACVYLTRVRRPMPLVDVAVVAGVVQLLVTAVTALLPGETARVWNFLIPLILLPAALELERWPRWLPVAAYALMAGLTALLARSLVFMNPG